MTRGLRAALAGLGLAVVVSFSIVGALQYALSDKTVGVLAGGTDNQAWAFFQLGTEHHRLHVALLEASAGINDAAAAEGRYEVFVSRLNIVRGGTYRQIFTGRAFYDGAIGELGRFVDETDALVTARGGFDGTVVAELLVRLPRLREPIQSMMLGITSVSAGEAAQRWTEITEMQRLATTATVIQAVLCAGFAGLAGWYILQSSRSRRELLQLTGTLNQAKQDAEAASRAKSEFLASMSHELRTPLNAIMGFSEVLKEQILGPLSERYRDYATDIHRSGQHLLDLISDLLNMARIEARQMEFQEETVPLSEIVEEAFRLTRLSPGETRQTVTKTLPDPMPVLRADRRALKQVLINLLGNAAKFTPEQGTVGLAVRHDPAGDLEITISDSGIGIPESRLPDLGKPFSRVENVMSRRYQGSGMGLFISKTLVERHGGTLTIASAEGHGTSVTVRLPAERLVAPDGNPEDRAAD